MHSRRDFCAGACHAALLTGAVGSLPGCGGGGGGSVSSPTAPSAATTALLPRLTASLAGNTVTLTIEASSPLSSVGGAALVQAGSSQLLIARTGDGAFSAVTAICTHEACAITGFAASRYVCPCHGSTFDTTGRVLMGPAQTSLRAFGTAFTGNVLTVTL